MSSIASQRFPFNQFPQRVGSYETHYYSKTLTMIAVSIQLVSPASGEKKAIYSDVLDRQFPFNQFPQRVGRWITGIYSLPLRDGFHSISFPSEWGAYEYSKVLYPIRVSIQLVSPASGELDRYINPQVSIVSIQLVSPASGEKRLLTLSQRKIKVSIQLVSPASGEPHLSENLNWEQCFHSISFPSEWGDHARPGCITFEIVSIQLVSPASGELLKRWYRIPPH